MTWRPGPATCPWASGGGFALALVLADPPDLLLLDEPTNHLSPAASDELERAFGTSPGAIVVATHDRWLRSRWPGTELRLGGV